MNRKNAKILLIGGDLRQLTAADELKRLGYTVSVCGFGTYAGAEYKDGIHLPDGTDAVLLPVPVFRGEYMNLPFSEERVTPERLSGILRGHTRLVCGGMIPAELSGGEQQRVSIARAVAKNPKLILCDEPTGALDYVTGKKILKLLYTLSREQGKLVIVVTHNTALKDMADKVIRIKSGRIERVEVNANPIPVEAIEW